MRLKDHLVFFTLIAVTVLTAISLAAASDRDRVLGIWSTPENDRIEIYRKSDRYFGKPVTHPGQPQRRDVNNPDPNLRQRSLAEVMILNDFKYDDGKWSDGTIYDPKNGKTYRCVMRLQGDHELLIRGYVGITLFGRSEIWKRTERSEK